MIGASRYLSSTGGLVGGAAVCRLCYFGRQSSRFYDLTRTESTKQYHSDQFDSSRRPGNRLAATRPSLSPPRSSSSSSTFRPSSRSPAFIRAMTMTTSATTNGSGAHPPKHNNKQQMYKLSRDFRTDTITAPTDLMFEYMKEASRGDDVYIEDDTTNRFLERIAQLTGKEAALYAVSGTMTNQLGIRTHLTHPPHSVVLDARSHIDKWEAGGIALFSQATPYSILPSNGHHLTLEDVQSTVVLGEDVHTAPTRLIALENTLSGQVFPQDEILRISKWAHDNDILMHCDGARMWEVVAQTGKSLAELCRPFDSVSLCLSKGLGAPIGSVLVGSKSFIKRARWFRKMFGGGIRQSGSLVAAASYCLDHHLPMLPSVHERARRLALGLVDAGMGLSVPVETNMIWLDTTPMSAPMSELIAHARESKGITINSTRLVLHHQLTDEAVDDFVQVVRDVMSRGKAQVTDAQREKWARFARGEWRPEDFGKASASSGYGAK